ncbi:MAG: class I SAM-dependent methyltransferase family protein [Pirellulales bacterium]|nr:class I SAM-dependent methyltransferase family protein [Pirellulales bacterium]
MKPLVRFWSERYRVDRALEDDSWLRDQLNRRIVGPLLNAFPRATRRLFALSRGELAQRLCVDMEGGSYRALRAMYEFADPQRRGDVLNRLLMRSPAAKAARNRRLIAERLLEECLNNQPANAPILVLALGGGDGRIEAEAISRSARRNVYYCSLDKDAEAVEENRRVMRLHGLDERGFVFTGNAAREGDLQAVLEAARRRFNIPFDGIGIAVCHGIAEYMDLETRGNDTLARMLRAVLDGMRTEGNLIISHTDFHDRVRFVERGLCWRMRLRSMKELETEVENAGWQIVVCEHEPMRLITMCMAVKSDGKRLRVDSPSRLKRLRRLESPEPVGAPA